jgi:ATP-dependent DNA helicase DinG
VTATTQVKQFFSRQGALAACLTGYEPRPDQAKMAEAIAALLAAPDQGIPGHPGYAKVLVVEAETGIGKSLAYLVPVAMSGKQTVISTATINLQDQLIEHEIPLLQRALGREIDALCVKGRQNYLCRYRFFQVRAAHTDMLIEDSDIDRLVTWADSSETGDRAELDWLAERSPLWPKISAHSYQCLGSECPDAAECFINRLRRRAARATLLVVNHHLYFSDLSVRLAGYGEVLPRHETVVFDEAHHLETVATTFFGASFSNYQVLDLVADIEQQAEPNCSAEQIDHLFGLTGGLRHRTDEFAAAFPAERGRGAAEALIQAPDWPRRMQPVLDGLHQLADELVELSRRHDGFDVLAGRTAQLAETLSFIGMTPDEEAPPTHVRWYERRERSVSLQATPITVADDLQTSLYASVANCIMTSATLCTGGSFDYIRERLGLGEVETLQLNSPFDYERRTILYVPEKSFPEPGVPGYNDQLHSRIETLLAMSRGRALVLFTSLRAMDEAAEYLEARLDYPLLVQGQASRSRLLARFRDDVESVLLAVASFWEGVDVVGESLSAVIIDKLPFEVPTDPVVQARLRAIAQAGGNGFMEFQVPRAVLSLRQGVGRLMRSTRDRGMIAVLDSRLYTKRYGSIFRKSMPPAPLVRELAQVASFFGSDTA